MPGLIDAGLRLVWAHLAAPGVARERGQLRALDPIQRLERKPRRVASGITIPAAGLELGLHLSRANDDEVAALHYHALLLCRDVEIGAGDAVAILEHLSAERARHVEENTAADHLRLGLLDPALLGAGGGHFAAIVPVPHEVLVEDMAEPVPLGATLQRHHHHVVGGADAAMVEHTRVGIGSCAQHGVHGIDAAQRRILAFRALGTVLVEIERERNDLPLAHEPGGRDDVCGRRVIERADLILGSPPTPVLVFLGCLG